MTSWTGNRKPFPRDIRTKILTRDQTCKCLGCAACGDHCRRPSTEADHIIPDAEGGPPTLANGQGMCKPCHRQKTMTEQRRGLNRWKRTPEPHPGVINRT